ncbi:MAG: hypothetical protein KAH57_11880 [Thermoplasmata archaeon]|nr:hypothetical protein [Thermoplasmata archaeon]
MRSIGKVVNFSSSGSIIVKGTFAPRIGSTAVDKRSSPVGKVVRITGPVNGPYLIVKPLGDYPGGLMRLLGHPVYLGQELQRRPREGGRRPQRTGPRQDRGRPEIRGGGGRSGGGRKGDPRKRR